MSQKMDAKTAKKVHENAAKATGTRGDESTDHKETDETHTDDPELETEDTQETDDEEVEPFNPFAAPDLPQESPPDEFQDPYHIVIIPKIVENRYEDEEVEAICEAEEENEEDKHQHYFVDQLGSDRPRWIKPWFNMAAMITFMVDVSCLNTFPVNVAKHGGVAYIIAYITVVSVFAYPMIYLEVLIGQYFQTGMIGIWGITPISRGLGTGFFYLTFWLIAVFPNSTLYAILYANEAFTGKLRWLDCANDWNTCKCIGTREPLCLSLKDKPEGEYSPAAEFFIGRVLQIWKTKYTDPLVVKDVTEGGNWNTSFGFENEKEGLGNLIPTSCLLAFIIFVLIMMFNLADLRYLGHMLTFTAFFPLAVLILLFCRAVTLEGAIDGLSNYLFGDVGSDLLKLFDISTWYVAIESAFFSLGPGSGCHIVLASFNPLSHDTKRDSIISVAVDTLMGLLGTVVSFMFVGHLHAGQYHDEPKEFPGENIIFVTQAESFTTVSGSSFFACIYYSMVVMISFDTHVVILLSLSFSLFEEFKRKYPDQETSKRLFLFSVWGFAFAITLVCSTRGGYWLFVFMNTYFFGYTQVVYMFLESIVISWIWGIEEVCIAAETILGNRPSLFLRISWKYSIPVVSLAMFLYSITQQSNKPISIFGQVAPQETVDVGNLLQYLPTILLGGYALYTCYRFRRKGKTCLEYILLLFSPEYEHQDILENVKNAKRLKWSHLTFIMFQDEKLSSNIKEKFRKAFQKTKNAMTTVKSMASKKTPSKEKERKHSIVSTKEKEKRKKKKKKDRVRVEVEEANSAWNFWDKAQAKVKKEHGDIPEVAAEEVESTKRSASSGRRTLQKPIAIHSATRIAPHRKKMVAATKRMHKPSKARNKSNRQVSSSHSALTSSSTPPSPDTETTPAPPSTLTSASTINEKSQRLHHKKGMKRKVVHVKKNHVKPASSSDQFPSIY